MAAVASVYYLVHSLVLILAPEDGANNTKLRCTQLSLRIRSHRMSLSFPANIVRVDMTSGEGRGNRYSELQNFYKSAYEEKKREGAKKKGVGGLTAEEPAAAAAAAPDNTRRKRYLREARILIITVIP